MVLRYAKWIARSIPYSTYDISTTASFSQSAKRLIYLRSVETKSFCFDLE